MPNTDKLPEILKNKINEIRREAKITYIESPYGYIDDSFFEDKAWDEVMATLTQSIQDAVRSTAINIENKFQKETEELVESFKNDLEMNEKQKLGLIGGLECSQGLVTDICYMFSESLSQSEGEKGK